VAPGAVLAYHQRMAQMTPEEVAEDEYPKNGDTAMVIETFAEEVGDFGMKTAVLVVRPEYAHVTSLDPATGETYFEWSLPASLVRRATTEEAAKARVKLISVN
jgi:hypothetical protein